ncbi:MAG: YnbE family lipoprotein [Desulfobulbaceae bacterium]|uniref:YnbE family lipoprotein n=1 Tax=Candidatus Desulfatifera sulfidica TaxID=2841691 RepID=A0A8J6N9T0_9BACT|nr:YnbE family lipoprotein [Candidatus Desulfatifera sulfidica]
MALFLAVSTLLTFTSGCTRHEVDIQPVEIKPIHITIDINLKVDRALDNFFDDLDQPQAQ